MCSFPPSCWAPALAAPAHAQRLSVAPYAGYGFFGRLPEESAKLNGDWGYGARAGLRLAGRWGVYGNFQRFTPRLVGRLPLGFTVEGDDVRVEHWSAGLQYTYFPGGAGEGAAPLVLELGAGEARYEGGQSDLALNLGASNSLSFTPNLALRYGFNDFVSNFNGDQGWMNQLFVTVGVELSL